MSEDFSEYIEKLEQIRISLIDRIDSFMGDADRFRDWLYDSLLFLNSFPNDELNRLVNAGFVPGARFLLDGKTTLTFVGYMGTMRMDFLNEEKNSHTYCDVQVVANVIERFKKLEDAK